MEWQYYVLIIFGSLLLLMATGMPIAFCFMLINVVGVVLLFKGGVGIEQLVLSIYQSINVFTLIPLLLFILMGELMFRSGIGTDLMMVVEKWLGRMPGRLGLVTVAGGTLLATLTGSSAASTAVLGSTLLPEMQKHGYNKSFSMGTIMAAGGLAIMIPPSGLAILASSIGQMNTGKVLVGIIVPGILMAIIYFVYIIVTAVLRPNLVPSYEVKAGSLRDTAFATIKYVVPLGLVVFLVIGIMFLGVATPTEAAATGTVAVVILVILNNRFTWQVAKKAMNQTLSTAGMIYLLVAGAGAFGEILSFTGATREMANLVMNLDVSPLVVVVIMQLIVMVLGTALSPFPIMMITLPIFMPIVNGLNFDPVWFAAMFLLNLELSNLTPPFGYVLFVMQAVAPKGTSLGEVFAASIPYCIMDVFAMAIILFFPQTALWLPGIMMK